MEILSAEGGAAPEAHLVSPYMRRARRGREYRLMPLGRDVASALPDRRLVAALRGLKRSRTRALEAPRQTVRESLRGS